MGQFFPLRSLTLLLEEIQEADRIRTNQAYLRRVWELVPNCLPGFPSQSRLASMDLGSFRELSNRLFVFNTPLGREYETWLDNFIAIDSMDENELLEHALGAPLELQYFWYFRTHTFVERLRTWRFMEGRPVRSRVTRLPGYRSRPLIDAPVMDGPELALLRAQINIGPEGSDRQSADRELLAFLQRFRSPDLRVADMLREAAPNFIPGAVMQRRRTVLTVPIVDGPYRLHMDSDFSASWIRNNGGQGWRVDTVFYMDDAIIYIAFVEAGVWMRIWLPLD